MPSNTKHQFKNDAKENFVFICIVPEKETSNTDPEYKPELKSQLDKAVLKVQMAEIFKS